MPWAGSGLGGALVQHGGSIDTREELVGALAVAAELDHFLLAQYLFAAYSMKKRPSEGISERQVELARRWEGVLLAVAREEMAHLAIVVNLSTAVGGAPHFNRPNFPQRAGPVYPFDLRLQRFGLEAIRRCVRFEQPADAFPVAFRVEIAPDPVEFTFLGDLYRQIRAGLETLVSGSASSGCSSGPPLPRTTRTGARAWWSVASPTSVRRWPASTTSSLPVRVPASNARVPTGTASGRSTGVSLVVGLAVRGPSVPDARFSRGAEAPLLHGIKP